MYNPLADRFSNARINPENNHEWLTQGIIDFIHKANDNANPQTHG